MHRRVTIFLLFLTFPVVVFAENFYQPGEYYVAPGVAYYHFSNKRNLQNTAMADVTVGYVVSEQLSLEALYGQAVTEPTASANQTEARFYTYWADGVYHFQPNKQGNFYPYLLGGIGLTNQNNDNTDFSGNTTFLGVNAGAGVEYFFNPKISYFADVRDVYTLSGGKNDWMLNIGIKFVFGDAAYAQKNLSSVAEIKTTGGFYELQENTN